jgi:hypothetical protein
MEVRNRQPTLPVVEEREPAVEHDIVRDERLVRAGRGGGVQSRGKLKLASCWING